MSDKVQQRVVGTRQCCKKRFWRLAQEAEAQGQITPKQIAIIWDRPRKRSFWCKHLWVLLAFLEQDGVDDGRG